MNKEILNEINNNHAGEYFLKHKDAVRICVGILEDYMTLDKTDIEWICSEFEQKCYIGSNKWNDKALNQLNNKSAWNNGYYTAIQEVKEVLEKWEHD